MKIFEEYNSNYMDLTEMASVCKDNVENVMIAVHPDSKRTGDCYFKYCNDTSYPSADKVIRIFFDRADYTVHKDGKELWNLNNKEKKTLMKILQAPSKRFKRHTNWEVAKYFWNCEYLETDLDIEDYFYGIYDKIFKDDKGYLPSTLEMPNYMNLRI